MSGYGGRNNSNPKTVKNCVLLSSLAFPQQKIVLVNDKIGLEPQSEQLFRQWIEEHVGHTVQSSVVVTMEESTKFLLMHISKLERRMDLGAIFRYVADRKKSEETKLLCMWATESKLQNSFLLPYLEHLADAVITFEDNQHLSLLLKKSSGAVANKYYEFVAPKETIYVTEAIRPTQARQTSAAPAVEPPTNPATLGTFKIDLRDEEIRAKNALILPFEFYKNTPEGGKILYHPDAADDLDEEDPDDDLMI